MALSAVGDTAWMVDLQGLVLRSTSRGEAWERLAQTWMFTTGMVFLDDKRGWIVGTSRLPSRRHCLKKTTNGGFVWSTVLEQEGRLTCLDFLDASHGWLGGDAGKVYRTEDAGDSWHEESTGLGKAVLAIDAISQQKVIAVAGDGIAVRGPEGWRVLE
jgi:photosystem II stability/assembly factor-like uncharacterized protein